MKSITSLLVLLLLGYSFVTTPAFAEKNVSTRARNPAARASSPSIKMIWNWFQLGGGAMLDSDGGSSGLAGLNWNPTLRLDSAWRLKSSVGALLGNLGTGSSFFIGEGLLSVVYLTPSPFWFEAGGGYQYWAGRRNFHPQIRGGIGYRLWGDSAGILNHVHTLHLSYTYAPIDLVKVHQVMASILFRI